MSLPEAAAGPERYGPFHMRRSRAKLLAVFSGACLVAGGLVQLLGDPLTQWIGEACFGALLVMGALSAWLGGYCRVSSHLFGAFGFSLAALAAQCVLRPGDLGPRGGGTLAAVIGAVLDQVPGGRRSAFVDPEFLFVGALNLAALLAAPILFTLAALAAEAGTDRYLRYAPGSAKLFDGLTRTLTNATFANAAGWIAVLFPVPFVAGLIWVDATEADWAQDALRDYLWALAVAPLLHLGFSAQRAGGDAAPPARVPAMPAPRAEDPVRPLYDAFAEALRAHVMYKAWFRPEASPARTDRQARARRREEDADQLLDGRTLTRNGNPDAEFYRLVSGAVSRAQDRGQACLLICPDKCGEAARARIEEMGRFDFPELARQVAVWKAGAPTVIDPDAIFDLVIAEESAFLRVALSHSQSERGVYLDNVVHRTTLVVAVDFQAMDASNLYRALREIDASVFPDRVGLLIQRHEHHQMGSQVLKIRGLIKSDAHNPQPAKTLPVPVEIGWMVLRSSRALREALLAHHGYEGGPASFPTAPYLALRPRPAEGGGAAPAAPPAFILMGAHESQSLQGLENAIREPLEWRGAQPFRPCEGGHHYAPKTDVRIAIVPDDGNFIDALSQEYAFWAGGPDHLVLIVSHGYPGRRFLLDMAGRPDFAALRPALRPMAQEPGIGITDVAIQLSKLLNRPEGLNERRVADLLQMPSGKIRDYLDITPTRRGLELLFSIIKPGPSRSIETVFDTAQSVTFKLKRGEALIEDDLIQVREEGTTNNLVRIARADEGLLFCENQEVRFGEQLLRLESVVPRQNAVTATRLDADKAEVAPEPRHHFRRVYRILAREPAHGAAGAARFVGESGINPSDRFGLRCYCGHIHVAIERFSDRFVTVSSDDEAEPGLSRERARPSQMATPATHRRPFRSLCILAFEDRSSRHRDDPLLGRTLAASLQVVLGLAFPMIRQRIAVVAIEAPPHPLALDERDDVAACLFPEGALEGETVSGILAALHRGSSAGEGRGTPNLRGPFVSLAVIEDASTDLGVARRVHDDIAEVLPRWHRFLHWAAEQPAWNIEGTLDAKAAAQFPGLTRA